MPRLFAQVENNVVLRVVVCDDPQWLADRLGGDWIETQSADPVEQYAGPGMGVDITSQAKFAGEWRQPTGSENAYQPGQFVFHSGAIWQSRVENNVWEPGFFGWLDPLSEVPKWRQPGGAGDEWGVGAEVMHNGRQWRSKHAANVWEPGVVGPDIWEDITSTETPVAAWVQPTGAHDAYQIGDRVTHNGSIWTSTVANNVWAPGVFGWEVDQ